MNATRRGTGTILALLTTMTAVAVGPVLAGDTESQPELNGYCPASYLLVGKAVKGDPAYKVVYQGLTYYLANEEAKKAFEKDPKKFLPQYGELCTTALGGTYGNRLPADPAVFAVHDGKLYLFSVERAKNAFVKDPARYIARADKLFHEPALGGYCPVSYIRDNKAVKGDPKYSLWYANYFYHFADAEAMELFKKDPNKYLPQFTMTYPKRQEMCALGVSRSKLFPALPSIFAVIDGKLYFFWDEDAKKQFMKDPETLVATARANWPALKEGN